MFFFGRFPVLTYKSVYNFPIAGVGLFVTIPRALAKGLGKLWDFHFDPYRKSVPIYSKVL